MQYLALIYSSESDTAPTPAMMAAYQEFNEKMGAKGYIQGGQALQASPTATCIKVRNGKRSSRDGPYSETKEQLAGYYLLECASLEQAIEVAAQIPDAATGTIELRPVLEM